MRPPLGESPSRRITQRNLYAVLECIDADNPGDSPLLKASVGSSAAQTVGNFPARYSTQYQKLVQWIYKVAQKPMPPMEGPGGGSENLSFADLADGAAVPGGQLPYRIGPRQPRLPSAGLGKGKAEADADGAADAPAERPARPPAAHGASDGGRASRRIAAAVRAAEADDPYDPATFNNQAQRLPSCPRPPSACRGAIRQENSPVTVENETFGPEIEARSASEESWAGDRSPKRKRGKRFHSSLARRASITFACEQYSRRLDSR